jgi:predicted peroxiredoxin
MKGIAMTRRFWLGLIILAALFITAAVSSLATRHLLAAPNESQATTKAPLLFNITSGKDGLHAVSMGLGLATNAAKQGHDVTVFLNVEAPPFAFKDLPDDVKVADFPPVKTLLAQVIANGGKVFVCEHCAHICSVDKATLASGVVTADHAALLAQLKPGTVCFSY